MENAFIGTIMAVGYNYVPPGWLPCNGQIVNVREYQALYMLVGNTYGGVPMQTFGIPDLRGYTIIGAGPSTNSARTMPSVTLGRSVGDNTLSLATSGTVPLTIGAANLPNTPISGSLDISGLTATSTLYATPNGPGGTAPSNGAILCNSGSGAAGAAIYYTKPTPTTTMPTVALGTASVKTEISTTAATFTSGTLGSGMPLQVVNAGTTTKVPMTQPSLGLTYIICWTGVYPVNPT